MRKIDYKGSAPSVPRTTQETNERKGKQSKSNMSDLHQTFPLEQSSGWNLMLNVMLYALLYIFAISSPRRPYIDNPNVIPSGWLGSIHQLTNLISRIWNVCIGCNDRPQSIPQVFQAIRPRIGKYRPVAVCLSVTPFYTYFSIVSTDWYCLLFSRTRTMNVYWELFCQPKCGTYTNEVFIVPVTELRPVLHGSYAPVASVTRILYTCIFR